MERRRQEAIAAERDNATVAALCTEKNPSRRSPAAPRCCVAPMRSPISAAGRKPGRSRARPGCRRFPTGDRSRVHTPLPRPDLRRRSMDAVPASGVGRCGRGTTADGVPRFGTGGQGCRADGDESQRHRHHYPIQRTTRGGAGPGARAAQTRTGSGSGGGMACLGYGGPEAAPEHLDAFWSSVTC